MENIDKYYLSKGIVLGILLLFIGMSILPSAMSITAEKYTSGTCNLDGNILYVGGGGPGNYTSIQDAIDDSNEGDSIFVRSGSYKENIVVDKEELLIQGEDKFTTVIDGGKITDAIVISAPSVTIQGFTITNGWNEDEYLWDVSGVKISSPNVTIKENLIMWNLLGINALDTAHDLTISDNLFFDDGILLGNYEHTALKFTKESFLHTITNNTVNGKPLYYYKNQYDFVVPTDAGQIILANCTNVTIKDMYFTHVDFPIMLGFCSNCVIENLTVDDTYGEIILFHSENNTIQNNTASHMIYGICLDYKSKNNIVRYNEVSYNYVGIAVMTSSRDNLVYDNIVHDNGAGIQMFNNSHDNIISENEIYHNNIGINIQQVSFNNVIQNNNIRKNKIGLQLKSFSNSNTIRYNTFKKNFPITAVFTDCSTNNWDHNYWNRPRILPKPIIGYKTIGKVPIPWINIDRHPASEPYEI